MYKKAQSLTNAQDKISSFYEPSRAYKLVNLARFSIILLTAASSLPERPCISKPIAAPSTVLSLVQLQLAGEWDLWRNSRQSNSKRCDWVSKWNKNLWKALPVNSNCDCKHLTRNIFASIFSASGNHVYFSLHGVNQRRTVPVMQSKKWLTNRKAGLVKFKPDHSYCSHHAPLTASFHINSIPALKCEVGNLWLFVVLFT